MNVLGEQFLAVAYIRMKRGMKSSELNEINEMKWKILYTLYMVGINGLQKMYNGSASFFLPFPIAYNGFGIETWTKNNSKSKKTKNKERNKFWNRMKWMNSLRLFI